MSKRLIFFVVLNMLVVLVSVSVGVRAYMSAGRYFARDVVYVAPLLNENHLHFFASQIEVLSHAHPDFTFSAESRGNIRIGTHTVEVSSPVIFTDAYYFSMHNIEFVEGSHWHDGLLVNSVVINHALAWRLFGTTRDITGNNVWINDAPHIITGVVHQAQVTTFLAWMPSSSELPISALYVRPYTTSLLAVSVVRDIVATELFRNAGDYAIICVSRYAQSIGIRYRLLLGLVWVYVLALLYRFTWQRLHLLPAISKRGKPMAVMRDLVLPIIWVTICVFLVLGVNDILYWLPNLSDPTVSVFEAISTIGLLPPDGYLPYGLLRLQHLSRHTNYAFIAGVLGLTNLLFCVKFSDNDKESVA